MPSHLIEVSGKFHDAVALTPEKEISLHTRVYPKVSGLSHKQLTATINTS